MDAIWWWIIAAVVLIALVLLILPMMRRRRADAHRAQAADLREQAQGQARTVQEKEADAQRASAQARETRAEADRKNAEAQKLESEAARRQEAADTERSSYHDQLREADRVDPDVDTDADGRRLDGQDGRVEGDRGRHAADTDGTTARAASDRASHDGSARQQVPPVAAAPGSADHDRIGQDDTRQGGLGHDRVGQDDSLGRDRIGQDQQGGPVPPTHSGHGRDLDDAGRPTGAMPPARDQDLGHDQPGGAVPPTHTAPDSDRAGATSGSHASYSDEQAGRHGVDQSDDVPRAQDFARGGQQSGVPSGAAAGRDQAGAVPAPAGEDRPGVAAQGDGQPAARLPETDRGDVTPDQGATGRPGQDLEGEPGQHVQGEPGQHVAGERGTDADRPAWETDATDEEKQGRSWRDRLRRDDQR
ncbi:hypothetical protein PZ938_03380 [Luteipulveratus sp. YIM 133132]|uniref:Uncharacterized protein n=1 Tax=Luteipulveratus flavus TaxID=3031728 RepID=A0ABT6C686_9MICO|nr:MULTISPECIES: hypothetical protein [unclassified Luteipulveratus]MDE9364636.1 hypothetical protein [Luteipulveratus sp. YIM 133132]MDF8262796.1 hypothetical protein [Luteipulveratus sp. YIM 133296]